MSPDKNYERLLSATRSAYRGHDGLTAFAPFPDDVRRQAITPRHLPCADVLRDETGLASKKYRDLQDAIIAAGPLAHWRDTFAHTGIGEHFLSRFGCYTIIGEGGPFASDKVWVWMVYLPPDLCYPWHHHPGEEKYIVIAGQAIFKRQGLPDERLSEDDSLFHTSNQPHAMQTLAHPVLCLVAWRNGLGIKPVLTE